jgi:DNA-binding HxlR family transcriptional regulator
VTYHEESVKPYQDELGDSCKSCTAREALNLIADKWTVLVIDALANGNKRYSEIYRSVSCITHKMLAQTLRRLERDGIVEREVYAVVPPKTEYTLTALGETLIAPIHAFFQWGEQHMDTVEQSRINYDAAQEREVS